MLSLPKAETPSLLENSSLIFLFYFTRYLKHQASVYGVLFPHHRELAADIRAA